MWGPPGDFELPAVQKHYCRQESKHSIFPPHCGIQCSIPSRVCPLRKRLPLSCHKNSSQIFDATKLWKHTIPLTYNTKTLISNISETLRFSPQMRLIAYPDHKTTLNCSALPYLLSLCCSLSCSVSCSLSCSVYTISVIGAFVSMRS